MAHCSHEWLPILSTGDIVECTSCGATKLASVKDVNTRQTKDKAQPKDHEH